MAASRGSPPDATLSYATWIAGRPSACFVRNALDDDITTGRPANAFAFRVTHSASRSAPSATPGTERPAAAAAATAPASRKSRRVGDTSAPRGGKFEISGSGGVQQAIRRAGT